MMTREQEKKCHAIIHSHAAVAAGANAIPIPGAGFAVDMAAMTSMGMLLAGVFGMDIKRKAVKAMALGALKRQLIKHPVKAAAREFCKFIPGIGQWLAPTLSVALTEAAGWAMVWEMDAKTSGARRKESVQDFSGMTWQTREEGIH